jgi:hypothetical protein
MSEIEKLLQGLPRYKLVSRPPRTVEEARDPTTIYGTRSTADIFREVELREQAKQTR